jgi:hypothetical protein
MAIESEVEFKPQIETSISRSHEAYVKAGFIEEIPHAIQAQYDREMDFQSQVDESKGPIKRKITRMIRFKNEGQEYLKYTEDWAAKDWKNEDINPVNDRVEGIVRLPKSKIITDERGRKTSSKYAGWTEKPEILYSKEIVDKLIQETGSDKDSIIYTVRMSNRRDNCVNYQQFINTAWNQANDMMMQDGGFELAYVEGLREAKANRQPKA